MISSNVTPAIAAAVLWKFGQPGGLEPGHFLQALLEAISVADLDNRARLSLAFPGLVEAYTVGANETYGVARLQEIAGVS